MCIYIGVRKFGSFQCQKSGHSYSLFFFLKRGFIIYLAALKGGKGLFGTHIRTMLMTTSLYYIKLIYKSALA